VIFHHNFSTPTPITLLIFLRLLLGKVASGWALASLN
jgi:hypothetical protein